MPPIAWCSTPPGSPMDRYANCNCRNAFPAEPIRRGHRAHSCDAGTPPSRRPPPWGCEPRDTATRHHKMAMNNQTPRRTTHWPMHLAPIGAIRFARRSPNFEETVRFYGEVVGLPLFETFEPSDGRNGAIFGLPSWNLRMEIVEAIHGDVASDEHE